MSKSVTVGSDESCDFPVAIEGVSSRHCRVIFEDGGVWVEDLNSTNGTFIDDRRIDSGERKRLSSSSELSLGGQVTLTWSDIRELRPSEEAREKKRARPQKGDRRQQRDQQQKVPRRGAGYVPSDGYAGFWRRWAAFRLDLQILYGVQGPLFFLVIYLFAGGIGDFGTPDPGDFVLYGLLSLLVVWVYFAAFESSEYQATLGKMAIGIKVTNEDGEQMGFWRATGRHFGKLLSVLLLLVGFLMAGFTERKQALHDQMTDCLVINDIDHPGRASGS